MNDRTVPPAEGKTPFSLPDFWKNNKGKIILLVLAAAAIAVCLFQCAAKPDYDAYLLYAGPQYIDGESYRKILLSVSSLCAAQAEDPSSFATAFDRITYVPRNLAEAYQESGTYYNGARNAEAEETFRYALAAGDYCILLLDPELYASVAETGVFVALPETVDEDKRYDGYALRLSALPLYGQAGFSSLPEDTLLVLRDKSFLQSLLLNKAKRQRIYERQVAYFDLLAGIEQP